MPKLAGALFLAAVLGLGSTRSLAASDDLAAAPLDSQIVAMVAAVNADRLRSYDSTLVGFGTRNLFSERDSTAARGVFAAREYIESQFRDIAATSDGRMTVQLDTYEVPKTERTPRAVICSSVVAILKGDDPSGRTYVMSSHYDSRNSDGNDAVKDAPGADDNGSGASAVIEAARVMAPHHFAATIVFATFDGEEQGLFGSDHFARTLKANHADVAGDLNNDIIGTPKGHGNESDPELVRLFSEALPLGTNPERVNAVGSENDSPSRELARFVKGAAETYVPPMVAQLIYRSDRFLRGGDQESFTAVGYPAVRFVEPNENFDHQHQDVRVAGGVQYGDLLQYLDFAYLARVTKMNVAALASLALGPAAPANARLVVENLGYDSTLRWKKVPSATSYEIVWRQTTASDWQFGRDVGDVSEATVPVSKDDAILGVRSVDARGRRSVVVYPSPARE